jgi:two-component system OmpR family sensor kinase
MIRTRLSLWNAFVFAAVLILMGLTIFETTRSFLYKGVDDDLALRTTVMEREWKEFAALGALETSPNPSIPSTTFLDPTHTEREKVMMALVGPRVFFKDGGKRTSVEAPFDTHEIPFDKQMYTLSLQGETITKTVLLEGSRIRVRSVPLREKGKVIGVAQFAADLHPVDSAVSLLGKVCLILLPIGLVVTTCIGIVITGRALKPVMEIVNAASQIEATRLSDRLPVYGNDEFATLSRTFNKMLDSLQGSFDKLNKTLVTQKQFVADASHELKTPLTTIKGRVGISLHKNHDEEKYREHIRAIGRSTDAMTAIVNNLIIIARADEASLQLNRTRLQVQEVVEEAIALLPPQRKGAVQINNQVPSELEFEGDRTLIVQALLNLLDNAVRHSATGGSVNILASLRASALEIVSEDFGVGIDTTHLPQIFDRFYRTDTSRDREQGGTGLGLSIVKSIAEAHGGTASLQSVLGKGTRVILSMPRA